MNRVDKHKGNNNLLNSYNVSLADLNSFPKTINSIIKEVNVSNEDYSKIITKQIKDVNDYFKLDDSGTIIINRLIMNSRNYSKNIKKINYFCESEKIINDHESLNIFSRNLIKLREQYNKIKSGDLGEKKVLNEVRTLGSVIHNSNISNKYLNGKIGNNQQDIVLISKRGLFIFEVKNWISSSSLEIKDEYLVGYNKDGEENNSSYPHKIVDQVLDHKNAILDLLIKNGFKAYKSSEGRDGDSRIHSFVTNANENCELSDHGATILDVKDINSKISSYPVVFSSEDVEKIRAIIEKNQLNEKERKHLIFSGDFLDKMKNYDFYLQVINELAKKVDAKMIGSNTKKIGSNTKKSTFSFFDVMFILWAFAIYVVVWVISWIATILLPFMVLSLIIMFFSKAPGTFSMLVYTVIDFFVILSRVWVAEWLF